jgi:hypothetical protein
VKVTTQGDFDEDAVVFKVDSDLLKSQDLGVELDFPYPPVHTTAYKYEVSSIVLPEPFLHTHNMHRSL